MRPAGREWLNGPLVWAIDEAHDFMYLFPRECPRILVWATVLSTEHDRLAWLGRWRAAAYVERRWLERLEAQSIYRYDMPPEEFEDVDDAGMWIARNPVIPLGRLGLSQLDRQFVPRGVDLRVVESLKPLKDLWNTSLHASGIRLRNASDWN